MDNIDYTDRIERFITNQMTPEELKTFLAELRDNPALRKEAETMALMIKEMKRRQAEEDAAVVKEVREKEPGRAKIVWLRRAIIAVAAIVILIAGGVVLWNSNKPDYDTIFTENYSIAPEAYYRGTVTDTGKELRKLFAQVGEVKSDEELRECIERLQTIHDNIDSEYEYTVDGNDVYIPWYLAMAYIKAHEPDKALPLLREVAAQTTDEELQRKAKAILSEFLQWERER